MESATAIPEKGDEMERVTRRNFVAGAALAAGASALAVSASQQAHTALANEGVTSREWADAADLIVVGGGGAGFCAAIEAASAGASVLVLEKAGFCGGDTQLSNGMIMAAGTPEEEELAGCTTDTPEAFAEQQVRYAQGHGDVEMIREMCLASPDAVSFMRDLGRVYANCDVIPPVWAYDTETSWGPRSHWDHTLVETDDNGHFGTLRRTVSEIQAIRIKTEREVVHLIVENGEVIGVQDVDGNVYRANKGVVLATASFGANKEMNRRYNHMYYWALCLDEKYRANSYACHPANTGDGIRMAQEIGADLALTMSNVILDAMYFGGVGSYYTNTDNGVDYTNPYLSTPIPGKILVNKRGKRFVQEDALWGFVNTQVYQEAMATGWNAADDPIGVWAIQDAANMANDVISVVHTSVESPYAALVQSADTIEELAGKIGVPADTLEQTVARWNEIATSGSDPDFDRRTDFGTIEQGPFYAYPYIPQTMGSHGGLRTNAEAGVLDVNGNPIPRLYAAGTIMSGMWCGPFYPSCGWAILGTVHWGRKAARSIVALDAWTDEPVEAKTAPAPEAVEPNGSYVAGTYEATGAGRNGEIPVSVEFSDTAILSVAAGENAETPHIGTTAIELLSERVVQQQSADIDAITGATLTSRGFLLAVSDCIEQASK